MNQEPNPMNQVAPVPPKEAMISPGLLVTFIIVVIAAAAYFGWNYFGRNKATEEVTPTPVTTSSTSGTKPAATAAGQTATALTYSNDAYGFTMTFPATWKDYKMKEATFPDSVKTYYIEVPTTDSTATGDSTSDKGYYSPFAITVYTLVQWNTIAGSDGPHDILITKNATNAFGWSQANGDAPADFTMSKDVKTIIDSFKLK